MQRDESLRKWLAWAILNSSVWPGDLSSFKGEAGRIRDSFHYQVKSSDLILKFKESLQKILGGIVT